MEWWIWLTWPRVGTLTTFSSGLLSSRMRRTKCSAALTSAGVAGSVAGLARTSFSVIFDGEFTDGV